MFTHRFLSSPASPKTLTLSVGCAFTKVRPHRPSILVSPPPSPPTTPTNQIRRNTSEAVLFNSIKDDHLLKNHHVLTSLSEAQQKEAIEKQESAKRKRLG